MLDEAHGLSPVNSSVWLQRWVDGKSVFDENSEGVKLLDATVHAAEEAGIKLVMCLTKSAQASSLMGSD